MDATRWAARTDSDGTAATAGHRAARACGDACPAATGDGAFISRCDTAASPMGCCAVWPDGDTTTAARNRFSAWTFDRDIP